MNQDLARDLDMIPVEECEERAEHFERPSGEGRSRNMANLEWPSGERCWRSFRNFERLSGEGDKNRKIKRGGEFNLYFRGIVSNERFSLDNYFTHMAGFGVAIFDGKDDIFKAIYEPLNANALSEEEAYIKALIEGLDAAINSGIERLVVFCDSKPILQLITGESPAKEQKLADLAIQVQKRERKFTDCQWRTTTHNDANRAFKYARETIFLQVLRMSNFMENCDICREVQKSEDIIAVDGCLHRYCKGCIKFHVQNAMLDENLPICPDEECQTYVCPESCKECLSPKTTEILKEHIKEASIPLAERVYCPYPQCSELMSRSEISPPVIILKELPRHQISQHKKTPTALWRREISQYPKHAAAYEREEARKCLKCRDLFCIKCMVPWHYGMTCVGYKSRNPNPPSEDLALMALATREKWRQCSSCRRMIELYSDYNDCADVTCRCGYRFCYNCGDKWDWLDDQRSLCEYHDEKNCVDSD